MKLGGRNSFDLSDALTETENLDIDTLDEIVECAVTVLEDYGPEDNTRISRMARWVSFHLANDEITRLGLPAIDTDRGLVHIGPLDGYGYSPNDARVLATMILRAAEAAEKVGG